MTKKKSDNLKNTMDREEWLKKNAKERIDAYEFPIRNRFMTNTIYDGKELDYRGKQPRKAMA